jgi:hypothetical protein
MNQIQAILSLTMSLLLIRTDHPPSISHDRPQSPPTTAQHIGLAYSARRNTYSTHVDRVESKIRKIAQQSWQNQIDDNSRENLPRETDVAFVPTKRVLDFPHPPRRQQTHALPPNSPVVHTILDVNGAFQASTALSCRSGSTLSRLSMTHDSLAGG